jgi:hypothetical protein
MEIHTLLTLSSELFPRKTSVLSPLTLATSRYPQSIPFDRRTLLQQIPNASAKSFFPINRQGDVLPNLASGGRKLRGNSAVFQDPMVNVSRGFQ